MATNEKIVLVTGANRGIGLEISRQLDELGHTVLMGCRDPEKGVAATAGFSNRAKVYSLDVRDEESIQQMVATVKQEFGYMDVLVNNAAIGSRHKASEKNTVGRIKRVLADRFPILQAGARYLSPLLPKSRFSGLDAGTKDIPIDAVKEVFNTNLYGPWRMMQAMIPLLKKSKDGRIINVSSGSGSLDSLTGQYPAYSLSKAGLNALTIMMANELQNTGIKVNAMCPGWVRTDMGGPNAPLTVGQGADTAVWLSTTPEIPTGKFFRNRSVIQW